MIHSFLLIGQSNMAGRGKTGEVEPIVNDRIKVLRNGRWQNMYVPVNGDRPFSGVNLAESFADLYSKEHEGVQVGLIPCADGGTSLNQWAEGGLLFDSAVYNSYLALRTSTIAGVLWHQGEADCGESLYPVYKEKLVKIINAFKKKLNLYDVPFLLGGLGSFLADREQSPALKNYHFVNDALIEASSELEMTGFVSADNLTANPDNLHFNSKSLREFGKRYYEEFKKLENKNKIFEEKFDMDDALRTEMELL